MNIQPYWYKPPENDEQSELLHFPRPQEDTTEDWLKEVERLWKEGSTESLDSLAQIAEKFNCQSLPQDLIEQINQIKEIAKAKHWDYDNRNLSPIIKRTREILHGPTRAKPGCARKLFF